MDDFAIRKKKKKKGENFFRDENERTATSWEKGLLKGGRGRKKLQTGDRRRVRVFLVNFRIG